MSHVADVVCLFGWDEDVPAWFWTSPADFGNTMGVFVDIAGFGADDDTHRAGDHWGGGKFPQCCVLAGAFNYLQIEEWLKAIAAGDWAGCRYPVISIHDEHDEDWSVYVWNGRAFALVDGAVMIVETP